MIFTKIYVNNEKNQLEDYENLCNLIVDKIIGDNKIILSKVEFLKLFVEFASNTMFIVDIDGTLAKSLFHGKFDINDAFLNELKSLKPYLYAEKIAAFFKTCDTYFVTGRSSELYELTKRWLEDNLSLNCNNFHLETIGFTTRQEYVKRKIDVICKIFENSGKKWLIVLDDDEKIIEGLFNINNPSMIVVHIYN